MGTVILKELTGGKLKLANLDFFPCVKSGITVAEKEKKEYARGYGVGLVRYLNKNAKGKIKCSYNGKFGYLTFISKHGNEIIIEIAGGSLNSIGDYLHVTNKTKKQDKYLLLTETCTELTKEDYEQALHICCGRLKWK